MSKISHVIQNILLKNINKNVQNEMNPARPQLVFPLFRCPESPEYTRIPNAKKNF